MKLVSRIVQMVILMASVGTAHGAESNPNQVLFAAVWKPTTAAQSLMKKNTGDMRLVVYRKPNQKIFAQIWSEQRREATCVAYTRELEQVGHEASLDMTCRSSKMESFTTHVALLIQKPKKGQKTSVKSLRFGSWLTGYSSVPLTVKVDRFADPAPFNRFSRPAPVLASK